MKIKINIGWPFLLMAIGLFPLLTHAQVVKDEYGVEYNAKDGMAVTISGKRDQLFRIINKIRVEKGLFPLVYKSDDQEIANGRAKAISKNFEASTASAWSEVIYEGTFGEITSMATTYDPSQNYHFKSDARTACIGIYEDAGNYFTVIRIF